MFFFLNVTFIKKGREQVGSISKLFFLAYNIVLKKYHSRWVTEIII